MRARHLTIAALAGALAFSSMAHGAPKPQIVDPAGDAPLTLQPVTLVPPIPIPGSQAYADILSVLWESVKVSGKASVRVTMTLSAAPGSGGGRIQVYRTYGTPPKCASGVAAPFFGFAYYTATVTHAPQSAIRENCTDPDGDTTLHEIPKPEIKGSTIVWTVPVTTLTAIGVVKKNDSIKDLLAFSLEIADFHGACVPENDVLGAEICGLAPAKYDDAASTASFKVA